METTIQIAEVNSKDVKTSRGQGTVYNVVAKDGREFSTFKQELGKAAGQLRGQYAVIEYSEVQKGEYTNLYLDSVAASDQQPEEIIAPVITHDVKATFGPKDDKSAQINRSVAFKAAVELIAAGVLQMDGVDDLDELTSKLVPIVDGSHVTAAVDENTLVKF